MFEFRLVYKGPLKPESASSGSGNVQQKHQIRKHFHLQLLELWKQHPALRSQAESFYFISDGGDGEKRIIEVDSTVRSSSNVKTWDQHIADSHVVCGQRFVPLVSNVGGFTCSLDVLFLRRDNPGHLIRQGGDIDNRIKTLLDALTMPNESQLQKIQFDAHEDPFHCLLEDDYLVTGMSVTTDRLLMPMETDEKLHDVHLVIRVTISDQSALFVGGRLV